MNGEILFLAHRMPFPPDRGDKIRSSHVLRHLCSLAPVQVATFAEGPADCAQEGTLAGLAASYCLVRRSKPLPLAGLQALIRQQPVSLTAFESGRIAAFVRKTLAERPISAIYVFSGQMGQYVPDSFSGPVIMDFVDVDSAKFEAYAAGRTSPRAWLDAREGRLLRAEEQRLARRSTVSLFVSDEEARLFTQRLSSEDRSNRLVQTLRNGIDSTHFAPGVVTPEPRLLERSGPRLIFTGQMDYPPNITAVERAITRLMPAIRRQVPDATFHVVGRNPPQTLCRLHGRDGCYIWGEVPDIRTWLAGATLALVPLEIARGVQNKVLEAMAMALPTVLTPAAATGIGAVAARDFAVAESDADLVTAVLALIQSGPRSRAMGDAARIFVSDHLSWPAALAPLEPMLGQTVPPVRDAA